MGLFSTPIQLTDVFLEALSPCFSIDVVGKKNHRVGLEKLGDSQAGISSALRPSESLVNIAPCVVNGSYEDF